MKGIISLISSILNTAAVYLAVPALFSIIGYTKSRPLSLKTIRKIVIINGACVWLIFQIIRINNGESGTSGAVLLWSAVAYWIMKKALCRETAKATAHIKNDGNAAAQPLQAKKKRRSVGKIAVVALSVLLALSLGFNVYQAAIQSNLQAELKESKRKASRYVEYVTLAGELEIELDRCNEKIGFFDEHIVMVEDDGTNLYHKYECGKFKGNYFWAYNVEKALDLGYTPCPICCKD